MRAGTRVLFWSGITDTVLEGTVLDGRRVRRGAVLVTADSGASYWREPREMLVLSGLRQVRAWGP